MVEGVKKIGVVGAGTMGAGVAQTFAAAGYPVRLQDIGEAPLGRGMGAINKSLERLAARGKLAPADKDATLSRITPTTKIDDLAELDRLYRATAAMGTLGLDRLWPHGFYSNDVSFCSLPSAPGDDPITV